MATKKKQHYAATDVEFLKDLEHINCVLKCTSGMLESAATTTSLKRL